MSLISFLNYIVFEIQYIVIKKSSSFSDKKKLPVGLADVTESFVLSPKRENYNYFIRLLNPVN